MDNQNIAAHENTQISIMDQVAFANKVINQIYAWADGAEEMRSLAKKEEIAVKSAKRSRTVIRILSPLFSIYIAIYVFGFLTFYGLVSERTLAEIIGILAVIVGIVFFWCLPCGVKQHKKQVEEYTRLARERDDTFRALISKYSNEIAVIPEKYRYPMASNYLVELFQLGRATTLPMAYDKLEEQIHRWKMESAMQEALAYQMQQAQALRNVQKSAAVSAAANTVSAVASVANFLSH